MNSWSYIPYKPPCLNHFYPMNSMYGILRIVCNLSFYVRTRTHTRTRTPYYCERYQVCDFFIHFSALNLRGKKFSWHSTTIWRCMWDRQVRFYGNLLVFFNIFTFYLLFSVLKGVGRNMGDCWRSQLSLIFYIMFVLHVHCLAVGYLLCVCHYFWPPSFPCCTK
jgi:hypothetical protein